MVWRDGWDMNDQAKEVTGFPGGSPYAGSRPLSRRPRQGNVIK